MRVCASPLARDGAPFQGMSSVRTEFGRIVYVGAATLVPLDPAANLVLNVVSPLMMSKKVLPVLRTCTCATTVGWNSQSPMAPRWSLELHTSRRLIHCTDTDLVTACPRSTSPVPSGFRTPAAISDATAGW